MARYRYQGMRRAGQYGMMRARRSYRRYGGAKGIAGIGLPLIGGVALGYMAPRVVPYQDMIVTLLAVAPVRLPYNLQNVAKGYVLGSMAKSFIPNPFGGSGVSSSSGDYA